MIRHPASSSGWIGLRRELSLSTRRSPSRDPVVPAPPVQYTRRNDCSDRSTPRTQRALSLRIGPQIQTLLSSEGRRKSGRRTGPSRSGKAAGSIVPGSQLDAETRAYPSNGSALESNLDSWLRAALAHATQSGRQLSEDFIRACATRAMEAGVAADHVSSVEEIVVGPSKPCGEDSQAVSLAMDRGPNGLRSQHECFLPNLDTAQVGVSYFTDTAGCSMCSGCSGLG